ncbi:MAG: Cyclic di-AMP synthase CdaA, partial [Chlamydiae bacterium]|nr:Cyclic di-AMP synthase CdaA [Chlamydiota bacterium]
MFHSVTPFIEMLIIAIMLNYLLSFFWNTRSKDLVIGLLAFLLILAASSWLKLPILHQILVMISQVLLIAVIIIFQPELRAALAKLSLKGRRFKQFTEYDRFLDQLSNSVYRLSERRIGALIVLE